MEKAFDYVNHCFLLQILRKFGFSIDFVCWIKTILKNQESCIIKVLSYLQFMKNTKYVRTRSKSLLIVNQYNIISKSNKDFAKERHSVI